MISFGFIWPLLLGASLCLFSGGVGYHIRDLSAAKEIADGKAAFARRIGAANAQTRATAARLSEQVQQSEAKIDELGQKYREAQAKLDANSCPLSDDDMRSLWNGSGATGARPPAQRRVRPVAGHAAAP